MQVALNIKLHCNQQAIHDSQALYKVAKCGKRFGKTKWAIYALIQAAFERKGVYWFIAPTYRQAKSIAWRELVALMPIHLIKRKLENELLIELVNGSSIELKGADNEDSLRGTGVRGVVFDEVAYINRYIWNNIIRGQLLGSNGERPGFAWFISSPLNPIQAIGTNREDWFPRFHEEAMRKHQNGDKDWDAFHFTIYDNPTLTKDQIDAIKEDSTDDEWNVEYMAQESAHAGTLVSEFVYGRHVKDMECDGWKLVRGLDWGIAHPTACLWIRVDAGGRKVHVENEFQKSGLVIEESSSIIKQMTGDKKVEWSVIDPSTSKRNSQTNRRDMDEFIRCGVGVIPGDNRDRGYDNMKKFFKKDMISVSPKCRQLIHQLKTVQYGQKEGEDCLDSLRYCLLRIHDMMFGGNLFPNEAQDVKRAPGVYNLNDPMFNSKKPSDFSWANCDLEDVANG